ncbi:MAG TPA: MYXO-CTERM sorting domain-containing protein [Polyangia bacterium]|nr:MYXO-CTERM sorting domain-containing protein [Polyangia bacterium]
MRRAQAGALLAAALALATPRPAAAFVRYVTEDNAPFFWAETTVAITGYPHDFNQSSMTPDQVAGAVAGAAAAWSRGQTPCTYLQLDTAMSDAPTPLAVNDARNSLIFHGKDWCHVDAKGDCDMVYDQTALAVTTDTANKATGQILDADVEVDLVWFHWADVVEDPNLNADMDLQNALTHEFGHLIGLDHTCYDALTSTSNGRPDDNTGAPVVDCSSADAEVEATTMYPSAEAGDIQKRTLAPDDQNAVCTIYSANSPPPALDAGCLQCATAGGPSKDVESLGALAALAAIGLGFRRRRTAAPRS